MKSFKGRLGIIQRVLPNYRAPFFDLLAEHTEGGLGVFAGEARTSESIKSAEALNATVRANARNIHILGGPFYLCWQMGLVNWLEDWNPDTLIVEANPRYISSNQALRWMQARKRPVIAWGLGAQQVSGAFASLLQARRLAFLNSFDAIVAYSQRGAKEYATLGIPKKKIFIAPNAVAKIPKFPPLKRPDEFSGPATILFVGRLQARKGVDRLLRACAMLPERISPRCVIVGMDLSAKSWNPFPKVSIQKPNLWVDASEKSWKDFLLRQIYWSSPGQGDLPFSRRWQWACQSSWPRAMARRKIWLAKKTAGRSTLMILPSWLKLLNKL